MAFKRLSMRKVHHVLRLSFEAGLSIRAIARSIQASPSTVGEQIRRAKSAVFAASWPVVRHRRAILNRRRHRRSSQIRPDVHHLSIRTSTQPLTPDEAVRRYRGGRWTHVARDASVESNL